ncbi:MAG: hypothetical protein ACYCSJ_01350 [Acidimicrobiales bacterium]
MTTYHATVIPMDSVEVFRGLAAQMEEHRGEFEALGLCDLDLEVKVGRGSAGPLRVLLRFRDYGCEDVVALEPEEQVHADCRLEGELAVWEEIRDDIVANGRSTGRLTISSLVLLGERLRLGGVDPMGVDRFFRYAETVQRFFDGMPGLIASAGAPAPAGA